MRESQFSHSLGHFITSDVFLFAVHSADDARRLAVKLFCVAQGFDCQNWSKYIDDVHHGVVGYLDPSAVLGRKLPRYWWRCGIKENITYLIFMGLLREIQEVVTGGCGIMLLRINLLFSAN